MCEFSAELPNRSSTDCSFAQCQALTQQHPVKQSIGQLNLRPLAMTRLAAPFREEGIVMVSETSFESLGKYGHQSLFQSDRLLNQYHSKGFNSLFAEYTFTRTNMKSCGSF